METESRSGSFSQRDAILKVVLEHPLFIGVTTSNPLRLNFGSIFSFWNLSKRKIELIKTNLDMISTYCNVIRTMVQQKTTRDVLKFAKKKVSL
jgi:hypothetical protein